jgi:hypothetical protein
VVTVSPDLASKPVVDFLVEPQNQGGGGFFDLGVKITATASWIVSQNQIGFGLSIAPQNRRREVGAGHVSRSSRLLDVEVSLTRVFQSGLKSGGDATTGVARDTITEVASESS